MQTFFAQTSITLLDWHGYSPNLIPIENLWEIIKRKLSKYECFMKALLIEATGCIINTVKEKYSQKT